MNMSAAVKIRKAAVFEPFRNPSRYKGAHGGRGSGKSHEFASEMVLFHAQNPGARSVCIRESQKSLKESAKALIEGKIAEYELWPLGFDHRHDQTITPGGGVIIYQGMKDHTAESVKSLEGMDRAWCEEAQTLSARSLELLRPTIRKPGSELWFSWNPRFATDPVDQLLRGPRQPSAACVIEANWDSNPWFPDELNNERLDCIENDPDKYEHIWNGAYQKVYEGAYFSDGLLIAEREGRVGTVRRDGLYDIRSYWDIGGTSRKADATAIWTVQFVGDLIKVLDYYEAVGQTFEDHVDYLRERDFRKSIQMLPHDGGRHDTVYRATPQSYLRDAGFTAYTMQNAGSGAARTRVEAVRRILGKCWFNADTTEAGRQALAWYHERMDENRRVGLGPEHDWSSHAADSFGGMALDFIETVQQTRERKPLRRKLKGVY